MRPNEHREEGRIVIGLLRASGHVGFALTIAGYPFAPVAAQQNFYAGKQIAIIVSSAPGGGYDARTSRF
jgi:tripartite-type tricarboxylate transporter receptor subunit TctC